MRSDTKQLTYDSYNSPGSYTAHTAINTVHDISDGHLTTTPWAWE